MKFPRSLAVICGLTLLMLVGCTSPAAPTATPTAPAAPTVAAHKVAMVTTGPTNDHGWHQDALEGVTAVSEQLDWEMAYSESVPAAQQQNVLRQYALQGYDLIYCHGYEWSDALQAVAPDFPNTTFVQLNASTVGDNIVGTTFKFGELGYFAGMAAGLTTSANQIGVVASQDAPQVNADLDTLKLGVQAVNPDAVVNIAFVGSWDDVVKGQQVAQAQIDRGADVLIIIGDAFAPPAIKLAQSKGVKVIGGWSGDAYPLAPDAVITSAVQDVGAVYMDIARMYAAGTLPGGTIFVSGLAEGTQRLGRWGDFVPAAVQAQVEEAVQAYLAGTLDIGMKP